MITLLAFARYRQLLGFERRECELPDPPKLHALLAAKEWEDLPSNALLAVNQTLVDRDAVLKDGDEVAFMPPVSGG